MTSNRLKMNADKTQLLWLGTRQQLEKLTITNLQLLSARVSFSTTISDLGVLIDSQLSMSGLRRFTLPGMLLSTRSSAPPGQIVTDRGSHEDPCACIRQQPARLLQQFVAWCQRQPAEDAAESSQCNGVWRLHIWQTTACLSQPWRADDTFVE